VRVDHLEVAIMSSCGREGGMSRREFLCGITGLMMNVRLSPFALSTRIFLSNLVKDSYNSFVNGGFFYYGVAMRVKMQTLRRCRLRIQTLGKTNILIGRFDIF